MNNINSSKVPRAEKLLRVGLKDLKKMLDKGNFAVIKLGVHTDSPRPRLLWKLSPS